MIKILKKIKNKNMKKKRYYKKKKFNINNKLRLSIFKSNKHIYAQIINDKIQHTLLSCSSIDKNIKLILNLKSKISKRNISCIVGKNLAIKSIKNNLNNFILSNNKYKYSNRIKDFIDSAKKNGLKF